SDKTKLQHRRETARCAGVQFGKANGHDIWLRSNLQTRQKWTGFRTKNSGFFSFWPDPDAAFGARPLVGTMKWLRHINHRWTRMNTDGLDCYRPSRMLKHP